VLDVSEVQGAARTFGLEVATFEIRRAEDIVPAFEALEGRAEALYVPPDPVLFANRIRINTLALAARLPTMHGVREYVEAGGLISYGPNVATADSGARNQGAAVTLAKIGNVFNAEPYVEAATDTLRAPMGSGAHWV
jgi:ABC-type uncharacterized transport system substrate-binding protein